ncbi:Vi polysaccharide biosynthesis UDP-N-acetylglucosamine C-6 dehydrogenase TviB [Gammaproteobacteria bacterium AS21]
MKKIAIIGLGYVGLPLAVEFGKKQATIGYDINLQRITALKALSDSTLEVSSEELAAATQLTFAVTVDGISDCQIYIVTVPTPIDQNNRPDLTPLIKTSEMLAAIIKKDDIVIFESTVYPGATEEVCIPIIEQGSGLIYNKDFFAGYSPERINPGDKERRVTNILKVTSGSTPAIADEVDQLYRSIITAGTHKASSIKVAEAAKVIENTQRDVNIALINELSIIFNKLGVDTLEVLEAAGTKWNFLPFRPGLVGGHCIGVDPYYISYKAQSVGYYPEMILAGRRINNGMSQYVVSQLLKAMLKRSIDVASSNILILGLSFKENCPDLRNTKVVDIIYELKEFGVTPDVYDPWICSDAAKQEYNIDLATQLKPNHYDAVIIAVGHNQFKELGGAGIKALLKDGSKGDSIIYDLKYVLPSSESDLRL